MTVPTGPSGRRQPPNAQSETDNLFTLVPKEAPASVISLPFRCFARSSLPLQDKNKKASATRYFS